MKVINKETTYLQRTIEFEVKIDSKRTVRGWRHTTVDNAMGNYESDIDYDKVSQPIVDALTDDEADELDELVSTMKSN